MNAVKLLIKNLFSRIGSMEQPVKSNVGPYKLQPGKIENYTPGHSSVSDKEAKKVIAKVVLPSFNNSTSMDNKWMLIIDWWWFHI